MAGTLYLVATPIGNLADITHRALQVLKDVELIACEDTRHTHKLLQHYGIETKTISYHEHNEQQRAAELIDVLKQGSDIAVVSDAGTPSISDPGFRLVRAAIESEVTVVPVPGPSALISALIAAGRLSAQVQATYGIDRIKEAVAAAAAGERDGKILVLPNDA